jgi:hypothetical protein
MISYEVTLQAQSGSAGAVEKYMRESHIPAILSTGCFADIRFSRASAGRFRTSYRAQSQAELDRYLRDHAPRFRAEFLERFPEQVTVTRETWVLIQYWKRESQP